MLHVSRPLPAPRCASVAALVALVACAGCSPPPVAPRGQIVVWIDTNLPVPLFADTLRVELLGADGAVRDERTVSVGEPQAWPVSLGAAPLAAGDAAPAPSVVRLRVRLYPSAYARRGAGGDAREPPAYRAIDRLVEIAPRPDRFARATVLLGAECLGVPADLGASTTCVATPPPAGAPPGTPWRVQRDAPASAGLLLETAAPDAAASPPASHVGSWADAQQVPCPDAPYDGGAEHPYDGERCVPGGVYFLGDERLTGDRCNTALCTTAPERLVRLSPFYMDTYEVTVDRWRRALGQGFVPPAGGWRAADAPGLVSLCTYGFRDDDALYPMMCVSNEAAQAFCAFEARARGAAGERTLPTEAQWEFAASGRGEERVFAWGNDVVHDCAAVAYGRNASVFPDLAPNSECYAASPDAAPGRFPAAPDRVDHATIDRSRDGVHDLSGNVPELTLDVGERYGVGCWSGTDMLVDPRCDQTTAKRALHVARGGAYYDAAGYLAVGQRGIYEPNPSVQYPTGSFRCVRSVAVAR